MSRPNGLHLVRKKWLLANPPDQDGNYICWLCGQKVHKSKVTVDHVAEVALYPEYAKNLSNLRPSHRFCNEQRSVPTWAKTTRFVKQLKRRAKK